eukprot:jgi/Mesvir1/28318/Mv04838-RA.1
MLKLLRPAAFIARTPCRHALAGPQVSLLPVPGSAQTERSFSQLMEQRAAKEAPPPSAEGEPQVLHEKTPATRIAVLNRPDKLNTLTATMVDELHKLYTKWDAFPLVRSILLKGSATAGKARALCAGGDVVTIAQMLRGGEVTPEKLAKCMEFFRKEYQLDYLIASMKTPHITLMDGIVMGGGAGLACHGAFRIATEASLFAMPETAIGFFPDVGMCYTLSRMPGAIGMFLGLTGARLKAGEMLVTGLATHVIQQEHLPYLAKQLSTLHTSDRETLSNMLSTYLDTSLRLAEDSLLRKHRTAVINDVFSKPSVEEIISALNAAVADGHGWCGPLLQMLMDAHPLSLKLTFRHIKESKALSLRECFVRDYRIAARCIQRPDMFAERVYNKLVLKQTAPKWALEALAYIKPESLDGFFAPFTKEECAWTGGDLWLPPVQAGEEKNVQEHWFTPMPRL